MIRESIKERGMDSLGAQTAEAAAQNAVDQVNGENTPFDPLMSMNWHWMIGAIKNGGMYLLTPKEDGTKYCPVCEFESHIDDFNCQEEINLVADSMQKYCREQGLIPKVQ